MKSDCSPLERLRIASPCPASWEQMSGDERVRFCDTCDLHVYNISRISHREAMSLITETEGRLCARIYRRADGTVITRDCPVGLRAIRRRIGRLATAAAVLITTICGNVAAFSGKRNSNAAKRAAFSSSSPTLFFTATIAGTVTDPSGAPIPNAKIRLTNSKTNRQLVTKSNKRGEYHFIVSEFGQYVLNVEAREFRNFN